MSLSMPIKPTLLAYLHGMPDVEGTYPVLARLHRRGNVNVQAFIYWKLLRREKRLSSAFQEGGLTPVPASKLRMRRFNKRDIGMADAVLAIDDPNWVAPSHKRCGTRVRDSRQQSIFLQHGVYQLGVNSPFTTDPISYYSQRLLFWEPLGENVKLFEPSTANRIQVVGFTKKDVFPKNVWKPEVSDWVARYPKRLLVCQSFRWGKGRYSTDHISHFYNLMDALLTKFPDMGTIIRSHRGRVRKNHGDYDKALAKKHPNVMFSNHHFGPLAKASIYDVIDICDAMVSPTSTTVLDCIYSGKPAAVFAEELDIFADLQQISNEETLEKFVRSIGEKDPVFDRIRIRFGELDDNLDRAAEAIEDHLLATQ